jgi:hypothetical protein
MTARKFTPQEIGEFVRKRSLGLPGRSNQSKAFDIIAQLQAENKALSEAAADVLEERRQQVTREGWTPEHDDEHSKGEMARAGACYAIGAFRPIGGKFLASLWPWGRQWWKPKDCRRDLVRAGALIIAEIERLDRATLKETGHE